LELYALIGFFVILRRRSPRDVEALPDSSHDGP
jgi:hypothetical protein